MAESVHHLEGTSYQKGGLHIKKRPNETADDFKKPLLSKGSLLGLDVLAEQKKHLKEAQLEDLQEGKRSKIESYNEEDEEIIDVESSGYVKKKKCPERHYRSAHIETPTHTGGVNKEALERQRKRERAAYRGVVYASSSNDRRRHRDKDDRYRDRKENRRKENRHSERRERDSERSNRSKYYNDWERTPSHEEEEYSTPRISRGKQVV